MNKIEKNFFRRDADERDILLRNIWCDECGSRKGVAYPTEYSMNHKTFIEAKCRCCKSAVTIELEETCVEAVSTSFLQQTA